MLFLHTNTPEPLLITLGPLNIYWYGVLIITGILLAIFVMMKLASYYDVKKDTVIDVAFWLIVNGIVGARIYHVFLELPYYFDNPLNIFKIWEGGLAIHGAIFAGLITMFVLARKNKLNFWLLTSLVVPGLAIAQAIGRWGNYFNQELYGRTTELPWGIPIEPVHRVAENYNGQFFHPTFLYESLGSFFIFIILIASHAYIIKRIEGEEKRQAAYLLVVIYYLALYSLLRFSLEFIRIDTTPELLGLRWPQIISILIILFSAYYIRKKRLILALLKKS